MRGGYLTETSLFPRARREGGAGYRSVWSLRIVLCLGLTAGLGCGVEQPVSAVSEATRPEASRQWLEQLEALRRGLSRDLLVDDGWVDDRAFDQLPDGTAVERLWLEHGRLTDRSVPRLVGLSQLRSIRLRHSPLSDQGVARLAELPRLESLNLPQAELSAVGLSAFKDHPVLIQLRVAGSGIDDACCALIAQMPALRYLHLIAPSITASGLQQLAAAPQLQSLYIDGCELPAEAWEAFFRRAPAVHVHVDQVHLDLDPNRHAH